MSTTRTDVACMSDTTMLFLDLTQTRRRAPTVTENKELKWLQRMIKVGTLHRHRLLQRRRRHNRGIPWWTSQETRKSWRRFLVFEMVCTVSNVWTLLMQNAVTTDEVRRFCQVQPVTPISHGNLERAVAMYEGDEDHLHTLEGALNHPELWCSISVATSIRSAVQSGDFAALWRTGYFDTHANRKLLGMLEEACFIDQRFLATLHEPTEPNCIAAGIAATKLSWFQLTELFVKRELARQMS